MYTLKLQKPHRQLKTETAVGKFMTLCISSFWFLITFIVWFFYENLMLQVERRVKEEKMY